MIYESNKIKYADYNLHVFKFHDPKEEGWGVEVISEDPDLGTTLLSCLSFGSHSKYADYLYHFINYYAKKNESKLEEIFSLECSYPDDMRDFQKVKFILDQFSSILHLIKKENIHGLH